MRTLFLHQNFPGQFRHLAAWLSRQPGHQVVAIGQREAQASAEFTQIRYQRRREPAPSTHHYLKGMEAAVLSGQAVLEQLVALRKKGFEPDVVVAHPGWGESLYLKQVYPKAALVHYCEYYYHAEGADTGFDPAFALTVDQRARLVTRNALHLLNLEQCDQGVTPTYWQKSLHPLAYQPRIDVLHEGVDVELACPDADARFALPSGRLLTRADKVITYVARHLEPYRGFPQFLQALALLQRRDPTVQALVIGADGVSYGQPPADAPNWREKLLPDSGIDPLRTHFLGPLPRQQYLQALQVSSAHVYLTYPFVLSWSLLEAMACGCLVIASSTAPVLEVVEQGVNGLLVDFFDVERQADLMLDAIQLPHRYEPLRESAMATVRSRYNAQTACAEWQALLRRLHRPFHFSGR